MARICFKLPVLLLVIVFLCVMFVPPNVSNGHSSIENSLKGSLAASDINSGSDPSVHLYVNGNGYVVFSANYSVDGILNFKFDNDRSQNFTTNDVPTGTVFHLVSSANSGYAFQKWTGSVNSTNNSIFITVNQNVNEEAIYQKESFYAVTFKESDLPSNDEWYVNLSNGLDSGPISGLSYSFSLPNSTYSYTIATSNKTYAPTPSSGSFTVNGSLISQSVTFTEVNYTVTFTDSGLPGGTAWYVNLTNGMGSGAITGSSYRLSLSNGSYDYSIATINKTYFATPSSGSIIVHGSQVSEPITFNKVLYKITFTESGFSTGTTWYVNLTGGVDSGPITGLSYSFSLTNGTYSYTLATSDKIYRPSPSSGSFTVNGAEISEPVTFSRITYSVTFTESGLPSGTTWYANLSDGIDSGAIIGTTYSLSMVNGTYPYTIATTDRTYSPLQSSESFTVNGSATSVPVTFSKVVYAVSFTESGFSTGTTWYVNLTGGVDSGPVTGSSYSFSLANGTYSYTIATANNTYEPSPFSGSFTVYGNSVLKTVSFSEVKYSVTFLESGLQTGTWYVNLSNGEQGSAAAGSPITFSLPNETYSFTVATSNKIYLPSPPSGSFAVNGSNVSQSVIFSKVTYRVRFAESGLPTGTTWYVNLSNGIDSGAITGSSYTFLLTNETYSYTVSNISGYSVSPHSGSIVIEGNGTSKIITYTATSQGKAPASGISNIELYGLIGTAVAIAAIGGSLVFMRRRN